jgi:energy-coupling factor transporter transmembrane protein EcfT
VVRPRTGEDTPDISDERTGFLGKIRSVAPIVISLVSNALLRSNVLGLTIDMRGYRTGKRTHVLVMALQARDYGVLFMMLVFGCIFGALMLLRLCNFFPLMNNYHL